jgi:outer membrane protein assembly factor BamD
MHKTAFILILTALVFTPSRTEAFWWWFTSSDAWKKMEPAEQNRRAEPYMEKARKADFDNALWRAASNYKTVWEEYPGSTFAPEALFRYAENQIARHRWKQASEALQRLFRFYPDNPWFEDMINYQFQIAEAYETGDHVYFAWFFPTRNFDRAVGTYEIVIRSAPFSDLAPLALFRIALIQRKRNNIPEAIDALDRMINNYPSSILTADAYLKLADTFAQLVEGPRYDQGATREAVSYFQDFMILFPENPAVSEAEDGLVLMQEVHAQSKLIMGEFFYKRRDNFRAAKVFFNQAITIAPDSRIAERSRDYLEVINALEKAYPTGNIPRRGEWAQIFQIGSYDPAEALLTESGAPRYTDEAAAN